MHNRLLLFLLLLSGAASAQISEGGRPQILNTPALFSSDFETVQLPTLDADAARAEDAKNPSYPRFAAPVSADISLENAGTWTEKPNGDRVWHCTLQSEEALSLILLFDQFDLPEGARLFAFNPVGSQVFGAYTKASCIPSKKFTIGPVSGSAVVLEYFEPASVQGTGSPFHLNRVDVAFDHNGDDVPEDFGDSYPCHININCPEGDTFQTEKKGVARILMVFSNGSGWCSGSMIANTDESTEPYFLTGHHCQLIGQAPDFDQWVFHFDYESVLCNNQGAEPSFKSVLGCERIAYRAGTDFMLLKLNPIPSTYGVYFNGWSRDDTNNTPHSTYIHHPIGDIKKISLDDDEAQIFPQQLNWGGVFGISDAYTHWKTVTDHGTFQPGSSGSPLLDKNKRIIGQLHGGSVNNVDPCIVTGAYFGMFSLSWNEGDFPDERLKEWLDPGNTNAMTQNGYWQPAPTTVDISGNVQTHWGQAMVNCMVVLSGGASDTTYTNIAGNYSFTGLEAGLSYTVTPVKTGNDGNGVSTFDLVLISKHVLGLEPLNSPWKIIAADNNKSNSVTTFDIVEGRKLILEIYTEFPNNSSWRFFPADMVFPDPNNPFSGTFFTNSLTLDNLLQSNSDVSFRAVKTGDVNNSADPN